jgi:hypothetical protein
VISLCFNYAAPVDPSKCTSQITLPNFLAENFPVIHVGDEICFDVHIRDSFDNIADSSEQLTLELIGSEHGDHVFTAYNKSVQAGVQRFCIHPLAVDSYTLTVSSLDIPISGFPVTFSSVPGKKHNVYSEQ